MAYIGLQHKLNILMATIPLWPHFFSASRCRIAFSESQVRLPFLRFFGSGDFSTLSHHRWEYEKVRTPNMAG
jgi:hypothetical protein